MVVGESVSKKGRRLVKKPAVETGRVTTPEQRILLLDTWKRSGLPAKEFANMVGVVKHTPYTWKKKFEECRTNRSTR